MTKTENFRDRARGAMYGVAVGDALGAPLEFMDAIEIKDVHGPEHVREMIGGGWLHLAPGETTDDTDMTLAVAEGLMALPSWSAIGDAVREVGNRFIEWHHSRPKDVGVTCRTVIEWAEIGKKTKNDYEAWMEASENYDRLSGHRSAGNGALMRTVPLGIAYEIPGILACRIARMTHWDTKAADLVVDYTQAVADLVRTGDWSAIASLDGYMKKEHLNPTGYSFDSMNCALEAIHRTEKFEEALVIAVNMGGDADTIGAITGGLAGAYYGFSQIPERWVNALPERIKKRLDAFVDWAVEREEKRIHERV